MKTNQVLERKFYDYSVRQNHKDQYFNLSDMLKIGNKYRVNNGLYRARIDRYLDKDSTKEFIKELQKEEDKLNIFYTSGRGTKKEYWGHKYLFLDFAMWLSPEFKIKVYNWLYDNLTVFRDNSGDSYKKMVSLIQDKCSVGDVALRIKDTARKIKNLLKVQDWNTASEKQLKYRDQIHNDIILLLQAGIHIQKATAISLKKVVDQAVNKDKILEEKFK